MRLTNTWLSSPGQHGTSCPSRGQLNLWSRQPCSSADRQQIAVLIDGQAVAAVPGEEDLARPGGGVVLDHVARGGLAPGAAADVPQAVPCAGRQLPAMSRSSARARRKGEILA